MKNIINTKRLLQRNSLQGQRKVARLLRDSLLGRHVITLETDHPDGDTLRGIILDIKPTLIVLGQEADFQFDGHVILPKKRIRAVSRDASDECVEEILRFNEDIRRFRMPTWLQSVTTCPEVLRELQSRNIWPGIELFFIDRQQADSAFFLGSLTAVSAKKFSLRCLDTAGRWEKVYQLQIADIFKIQINDRYGSIFTDFVKKQRAKVVP